MAEERTRALVVLAFALLAPLFVLVSSPENFRGATIYVAFSGLSLILYSPFLKDGDVFGIPDSWPMHALLGIGLGLGFLYASTISSLFSLAIPPVTLSLALTSKFLLLVVAPILYEEALFRGWLLPFVGERYGFIVGLVASSVAFVGFHFFVYGGLTLSTALVGAGIFAVIAGSLAWFTESIVPGIAMHFVVNMTAFLSEVFV